MTSLLTIIGWTLIHFLWQACLIVVPVAAILRLTQRRSANLRYLIACAGLLAMIAAPIITARVLLASADRFDEPAISDAVALPVVAKPVRTTITEPDRTVAAAAPQRRSILAAVSLPDLDRIAPDITIVWLAGVALLLARMAGGWWTVRRLHRAALATDASRWQVACRRIAFRLGLPAAAHVVESSLVDVPAVVGWLRPAILLPVAALSALTPSQVEAILAHELAHIRRHDYLVNVLQTLAETVLFYHPAVWWVSKRIRIEREHCCDDIAVAVCGDALNYAEALAVLELSRSHGMALAMAATGGSLVDRVRRILRRPVAADEGPRSASWAVTLALTLVFTAGAGSIKQLPWPHASGADIEALAANPGPVPGTGWGTGPGTVPGTGPEQPQPPAPPVFPQPPDPPTAPEPPEPPEPPVPPTPPGAQDDVWVPPMPPMPPAPPTAVPPPAPPAPPAPIAPPMPLAALAPQAPPAPPAPPTAPAPPAPPAPPAAPAPPAPPSGGFSMLSHDRGESRWSWSDDDVRMEVTLHGSVAFKDDLSDVERLSDDGLLRIRDWTRLIPRTIEIRSENGRITHSYYVAGVARTWDADAEQRLREVLPKLVRRTGLGAESRVRTIFEAKGTDGVLDEIALLESDYARRLYFVALIDRAQPDAAAIVPILRRMDRIRSDYERGQVLQRVANRVTLDPRAAVEYVRAASPIKSDYERRRALSALLAARPLPQGAATLAFRSAVEMRSDYDRSEVLRTALAQDQPTEPEPLFAAVGRMSSSYEQRRVLTDLASRNSLSLELKRGLLTAATAMKSDYERATVLLAYIRYHGAEAAVRQPLFAAVNTMSSDYEKRRVLTAVAASTGAGGAEIQRAVFDSVGLMRSDYERAEVLLSFVRSSGIDSTSRSAFVAAAERMTSSHEQNRVLGALVRSERR